MITLEKDKDLEAKNTKRTLKTFKIAKRKYPDDSTALHTDLYQLNMAETYWADNMHNRRVIFEAFYRKIPFGGNYVVFAGLDRVIDYLANFKFSKSDIDYLYKDLGYKSDFLDYLKTLRFTGNIKSVREGELIYPNEPIIEVDAPLAQAQLIETPLLNIVNFHSLIATKAARMRCAAGKGEIYDMPELMEFGTRRAQEFDAALYGTRAAYIGGFNGTSNVRAGKLFGIPVKGTHAHSLVQVYGDEYTAFMKYAQRHKNCVFLVDTYDTLKSGVPNAIRAANDMSKDNVFVGVRLDSGDLAYLSKEAKKMMEDAGYPVSKVTVSNELDEYEIEKLNLQNAKAEAYGLGTKLITAYDNPALSGVYKIAAIEDENGNLVDRIKISEDPGKTTIPGHKKTYRIYDNITKENVGDYIALAYENPQEQERITIGMKSYTDFAATEIHEQIFQNGKLVYQQPSIHQAREYSMNNLRVLKNCLRNNFDKDKYMVALSPDCYENKIRMIEEARRKF